MWCECVHIILINKNVQIEQVGAAAVVRDRNQVNKVQILCRTNEVMKRKSRGMKLNKFHEKMIIQPAITECDTERCVVRGMKVC
jgi:hypothetical protein